MKNYIKPETIIVEGIITCSAPLLTSTGNLDSEWVEMGNPADSYD